jgi:anti-sigma regulatory factor (Ser/Thr protein kinase)
MDLDLDIPRDVRAPSRARQAIGDLAEEVDDDVLGDVVLLVSELVSNAVKYGDGEHVTLRVQAPGKRRVAIEVLDAGTGFSPDVRTETEYESAGFGFHLVDQLASRWGVHEGTAHVWFEIDRSSDLAAAA